MTYPKFTTRKHFPGSALKCYDVNESNYPTSIFISQSLRYHCQFREVSDNDTAKIKADLKPAC